MTIIRQDVFAHRWIWLLICMVAALPYYNSLNNSFHDDDEHSIVRNHHLRDLANIPSYFADSGTFSAEPGKGMYRPLLQTTLAFNYASGAYEVRGYHVVSILFHVLSCIGLWLLLSRLLPAHAAVAICLLYAAHPIHTQAVNYISSRSELMAGCGVIWSLWAAVVGRRWFAGAAFIMALLSKSVALQGLPLAVLLAWRGHLPNRWRGVLPFLLIAVGYVALITVDGFLPHSLAQQIRPISLQLTTQALVVVRYLHLLVMPMALSIEHGIVPAVALGPGLVAAILFLASLVTWSMRAGFDQRSQWMGVGSIWFFIGLSVTILVPLTVIASEQRLYLSTAGLLIAVVWLCETGPRESGRLLLRHGWMRRILAFIVTLFCLLSVGRNKLWESELSLWSDAVKKAPGSVRAWSNYALALHHGPDGSEAFSAYEHALAMAPDSPRTRVNLGVWLEQAGRWPEAEAAYLLAAQHRWSGPRLQLARLYLENGLPDKARAELDTARGLNATDAELHLLTGRWHQAVGDPTAARASYEETLRLDPTHAAAANNLGMLLIELGEQAEGSRWLERALANNPAMEEARVNLRFLELRQDGLTGSAAYQQLATEYPQRAEVSVAWASLLGRMGEWHRAVDVLDQARVRTPASALLSAALGDAHRARGRWAGAVDAYSDACDLAPFNVATRNRYAAALAATGDPQGALAQVHLVLRRDPQNAVAQRNLELLNQTPAGARSEELQSP
jgi:Tfp pilus assembly protein PilF